jgi:acid phosphatase (class A)
MMSKRSSNDRANNDRACNGRKCVAARSAGSSAALLTVVAAGILLAQTAPPPITSGYLGAASAELFPILPPAPAIGDARDGSDRAVFRATRSLDGSARWALAQSDDNLSVPGLLSGFACSLGAALDSQNAPRLSALLSRVASDAIVAVARVKEHYHRKRPFLVDEGPICLPRTGSLLTTFDYPSGHATLGWATGLLLAEIAPGRAAVILARARAFGDSRVICGVHSASAVEAGRMAGAALAAELHGSAAFRADLERARREFIAVGTRNPPKPESCAAESAVVGLSPDSLPLK